MPLTSIQASLASGATGQPKGGVTEQAREALSASGIVILRDAVDPISLGVAHEAILGGLAQMDVETAERQGVRVGDGRYMVTLNLDPPFDRAELFASPPLLAIARLALGADVIINSLAVVIAFPGALAQRAHVDHEMLFPLDETASMGVPIYALTAIIPLLDLDESTGSTEVWPLGPRMETPDLWNGTPAGSTVLPLGLGDAALIDYRVCHRGTANPGLVPRPILYIVYSRPWFRDADNFSEMPPLRVSAQHLANVPAQYRRLFASAAAGHLE